MGHTSRPTLERGPWWFVPALALVVALGTGFLEVPAGLLRRSLLLLPLGGDEHVVWMAPLANLILLLVPALLLWAVHRLRPSRRVENVITILLLTFAAFALLRYFSRAWPWAMLILALGIATRLAAAAMRRRESFHRLLRRLVLIVPAIVLLAAGAAFAWAPLREWRMERRLGPAPADAPNVLLLVLDTVRAMSLGLYGYERPTTPVLDSLAASSTVFDQAIVTSSWTLPSHAGMFTGRWPHELNAGFRTPLDSRWPTIAEVLATHGYATAGFSANVKYASYEHGLDRGFARYEDYRITPGQVMISSSLGGMLVWQPWFQNLIGFHDLYGRTRAASIIDAFLHWETGRNGLRPFFAFLNLYDAHDPVLVPPPWDRMFMADDGPVPTFPAWPDVTPDKMRIAHDAQDGAIRYLDYEIGRLVAGLRERDLLDHTLLIITSDHGEQFGEHDIGGHGNTLYRPLLDVPLLLRLPGRLPEGRRIEEPVTLRDLPATILDLAGVPNDTFPGRSLARTWRGDTSDTRSPLLAELTWPNGEIAYALRADDHVLIDWFGGKHEFYDLGTDPGETRNLLETEDSASVGPWRARMDSLVGGVDRGLEVGRVQAWLTGIHR